MVIGYEAAGRIGDARRGGRGGLHASQLVAFGGAVAVARLLKLTDQQMAHALGIVATTMGGLAIGTNSWAREYMGANAAGSAVDAAEAAARGYTVNDDMLGARGGFVEVFGGGRDAVRLLSSDLGQRWDIVEFLAIKLWPGAHPFSGTLEAAVNAARQANVPADDVAQILIAGPDRTTVGGSRRPRDLVEAIHSLPYFVASAVADKEFTWIHATEGKIFDPVVARLMDLWNSIPRPDGHLQMELGRQRDAGDEVRSAVHEHRGRASGIRSARHRVERRGRQVSRTDARLEASGGAARADPRRDPSIRACEERPGVRASADTERLRSL
jgi:2-methylcitrate dehydratase PrpD